MTTYASPPVAVYTGDGSTRAFTVPFLYLDRSHVVVLVNGSSVSFTWVNAALVELATAPVAGARIVVQRRTPANPIVDFQPGAALQESDLDTATLQAILLSLETREDLKDALLPSLADGQVDAGNRRIRRVSAPIDPTDAANKAYVDDYLAPGGPGTAGLYARLDGSSGPLSVPVATSDEHALSRIAADARYPQFSAVAYGAPTRNDLETTTVPAVVTSLRTSGFAAPGDMGHGLYRRVGSMPTHTARVQSADGAWWSLVPEAEGVNILQLGAVTARNAPAVDATPFFNAMDSVCLLLGVRTIRWPAGNYYFNTQPNTLTYGVQVLGDGMSFTVFRRNFVPGSATAPFVEWTGANELGGGLDGVTLLASAGTTGTAIRHRALSNTQKPDFFKMGKVNVTSSVGSTWNTGWLLEGQLAPDSGGSKGIRNMDVEELYIFNCTANAINANLIVNPKINYLFTSGSAAGTNGNVTFTGTTDPNTSQDGSTSNVRIFGVIGGAISFQNSELIYFLGTASGFTVTSSAINGTAIGNLGIVNNTSARFQILAQSTNNTSAVTGHVRLPNGLLLNWGRSTFTSGTPVPTTFNQPFTVAPHVILGNMNYNATFWASVPTVNGFTANQSGTSGSTANWIAIGI